MAEKAAFTRVNEHFEAIFNAAEATQVAFQQFINRLRISEKTMPKRTDIKSVLILGAGPIVIGQACEFDNSGAQACKALREEGYRVVLVNSNPATIMTDPAMADAKIGRAHV